jgi:Helix-turn-helix domain
MSGQPISGHKGRDRWMCALAAASDLSTMAIRLTLRLCVSFNCKTGQCDPGYRTLAGDMAVSERSVFRAIAELEAGGWITVDRTGGDNTRNNQFTLLIPSAQVTTVVTRSGDNMVSPEKVSVQVTENGGSGDRNRGVQVTDRLAGQKNLRTCEPEIAAEGGGYHTSRVVRDSASSSTSDDATIPSRPDQRADALIETVEAQPQPSSATAIGTGPPPDADAALASVYRRGREVLGADADAVTAKLLSAYDGDAEGALDTLACAGEVSDPRQYIERDIEAAVRRQGPRQ